MIILDQSLFRHFFSSRVSIVKIFSVLIFFVCNSYFSEAQFITTWTTNDGTITIPTNSSTYSYSYDLTWSNLDNAGLGDGSEINQTTDYTITGLQNGDTYEIEITGTFPAIYFNNSGDTDKIRTVEQWGGNAFSNMSGSFYGCTNLTISATDNPDLSGVLSLRNVFRGCTSLNQSLDAWDVSNIVIFTDAFRGASSFNQPLNSWDVSSGTNFEHMFDGASNFDQPLDNWTTISATATTAMFKNATSFNQDINSWNMSGVGVIAGMFEGATSFNQPLNNWNTGAVTNIGNLFFGASSFNQPLNNWDVSNVTNMGFAFLNASSFNQSLGDWDVRSVTDMSDILSNSGLSKTNYSNTLIGWAALTGLQSDVTMRAIGLKYNTAGQTARNTLISSPNNWDIQSGDIFEADIPFITTWSTSDGDITIPTNSSFTYNYNISWSNLDDPGNGDGSAAGQTGSYTITGLTTTGDTYQIEITGTFPAINFNMGGDFTEIQSVEQWGDISWESMNSAFYRCLNLVVNASDAPDLSNVTDMSSMFSQASSMNADLSAWDVSNVNDMSNAFFGTDAFNYSLDAWDVSNVTDMSGMFQGALVFNQPLNNWDVGIVQQMASMFQNASAFDRDISGWDVSSVTNMQSMFQGADDFNQAIGAWGTDMMGVQNISNMFFDAASFDQPLNAWDVSGVTTMIRVFHGTPFDQPLDQWASRLGNVTTMVGMFSSTSQFDQPLDSWDVSNVSDMQSMFYGAAAFNQDLNSWDMNGVTDTRQMFRGATAFNGNIEGWDVSTVEQMTEMFWGATAFDRDLSSWDVGMVQNMRWMFNGATLFNAEISGWNTGSVTDMLGMFNGAIAFNQDLGNWDISLVSDMTFMLNSSGLSVANYDATLIGWESQAPSTPLTLGASGLNYCTAETARDNLINNSGWTINDGTVDCSDAFIVTNTNDTGVGSLRWCVTNANSTAGANTITFDPSVSGGTISIFSPITITSGAGDGTTIDGDIDANGSPDITIEAAGDIDGILVTAANCQIEQLHMQGFGGVPNAAIKLDGATATGNTLIGNLIGTDITGNSDGTANYTGIDLRNGANGNFIGDGTASGTNVIGNNTFGVQVDDSNNNTITGNNIGIGLDGSSDVGNVGRGINLFQTNGTIVGVAGDVPNVISNNSQQGILLDQSPNATIVNNYIGVDDSGLLDMGNATGIELQSSHSVQIGAASAASRNIISGHGFRGIHIEDSDDVTVLGNYLGLGTDGSTAIPNGGSGPASIDVDGTSVNAQIGDGTSAGRNVISASRTGIRIGSGPTTVQGNYIGTDASGTLDRGNTLSGISLVSGGSGTIGGKNPGEGNVISGNAFGIGVSVGGFDIFGNLIGTNASGDGAIPNDNEGIRLTVGSGTHIGDGSASGANVISGNTTDGILVSGASTSANIIAGNLIGVEPDGSTPLGNGNNGILIEGDANGNTISGNTIAHNTLNGVEIGESSSTGIINNTLSQNAIYNNANEGILITNGAQNGIVPPTIVSATAATIFGTGTDGHTIEVFTDNLSVNPQGENYLGSTTVSSGIWSLTGSFNTSDTFTATTTDGSGNTSEFALLTGVAPEINVFQGLDNSGTPIADGQAADIDFGTTEQGTDITLDFAIENSGSTTLNVSSIVASTAEYSVASAPTSVLPGNTETFTITLDASNAGIFNATITINNDDADEDPFTFPVTGQVTDKEINVYDGPDDASPVITDAQATPIDFGTSQFGTDIVRAFSVENSGSGVLTVSSISSNQTEFSINSSINTLSAGTLENFTVTLDASTVGTFNATITITSDDSDEGTFTFDVTGEITQQSQTITFGALSDVTYGDSDFNLNATASSGLTVSYSSSDPGVATVSGNTVTIVGVGTTDITASQAGNANYAAAPDVIQSLTVNARPIEITADAQTKVYGDTDPALTYTLTSGSLVGGDSFSGSLLRDSGEDVGTYAINQGTLTAGSNYAETYVSDDLTITQKTLTATADDKIKAFMDPNPPLTITYTGFAFSDDASVLDTEPTITTTAIMSSPAGTYPITLTGGTDNNYVFNLVDGTLTIVASEIAVYESSLGGTEIFNGQSEVVNLGQATEGNNISMTFVIENQGTGNLNITSITTDNSAIQVVGAPSVIVGGNSASFDLEITGAPQGTYAGDVTIVSDDADESSFIFPVEGRITKPEMGLSLSGSQIANNQSSPVDIGSTAQGEEIDANFTINNSGDEILQIFSVDANNVSSETDVSSFEIVSFPSGIAAGSSGVLTVSFDALTTGTYQSEIVITSSDPDNPTFTFTLQATAEGATEMEVYAGDVGEDPIEVSSRVDMGVTQVGIALTESYSIFNPSNDQNLVIASVNLDSEAFSVTSFTESIPPQQSGEVVIEVMTDEYGEITSQVEIVSNFVLFSFDLLVTVERRPPKVYNVITPNNDGIHDFLKIERIADYPGNRVVIFDRTGKVIYEATDYNNEDVRFDGTANRGTNDHMRAGTYYYVIDVGQSKKYSGYLQLVRN